MGLHLKLLFVQLLAIEIERRRQYNSHRGKRYYQNNRQKKLDQNKRWRLANPERFRDTATSWRKSNHSKMRAIWKRGRIKNKSKRAAVSVAYHNHQYRTNPVYRVKMAMYRALNKSIARKHVSSRSQELLGCTFTELKAHLESLFQPGMTWQNHGVRGWHIDHVLPIDSFDLTDPEQVKKCFHFSNLQPLWAVDNLIKGNRMKLN